MNKIIIFTLIIAIQFILGCVSTGGIRGADKDGVYHIEAENMILEECVVIDADGASGGKGVEISSLESTGYFELKLSKGEYAVTASILASDGKHDAFYIIAAEKHVQRVYPHKHKQWSYCPKMLTFSIEDTGTCRIRFAVKWWKQEGYGETGMILDKLELVPMHKAEPVITKWQSS